MITAMYHYSVDCTWLHGITLTIFHIRHVRTVDYKAIACLASVVYYTVTVSSALCTYVFVCVCVCAYVYECARVCMNQKLVCVHL